MEFNNPARENWGGGGGVSDWRVGDEEESEDR